VCFLNEHYFISYSNFTVIVAVLCLELVSKAPSYGKVDIDSLEAIALEVLTDQETKDMIWRKGDTMFYKGGVTDPDYCVLKFTAEAGRYYCDLKTESFTIE
jgi:general stress protein 26